ncbi:MAG: HPr family phosphocarrier protein [Planctomycetota bacterium]|jgi:phosphotransferase system HPr (HPr) family protein|nr:HPr family phosphocarrier protein [Planctomycetota bacterium]
MTSGGRNTLESDTTLEVEKNFILENKEGLHVRPATLFVQAANEFEAKIEVVKDGVAVDGKSIFEILSLAAGCGTSLTVRCSGKQAQEALSRIESLFASHFEL